MESIVSSFRPPSASQWRDLLLPREHGSWSLAFEPLALGLIAAPSVGGSSLALAVAAAFFGRRPLRIAWRETRSERTLGLLVFPRPALRALSLGMIEAALGVAFVVTVAVAWHR